MNFRWSLECLLWSAHRDTSTWCYSAVQCKFDRTSGHRWNIWAAPRSLIGNMSTLHVEIPTTPLSSWCRAYQAMYIIHCAPIGKENRLLYTPMKSCAVQWCIPTTQKHLPSSYNTPWMLPSDRRIVSECPRAQCPSLGAWFAWTWSIGESFLCFLGIGFSSCRLRTSSDLK